MNVGFSQRPAKSPDERPESSTLSFSSAADWSNGKIQSCNLWVLGSTPRSASDVRAELGRFSVALPRQSSRVRLPLRALRCGCGIVAVLRPSKPATEVQFLSPAQHRRLAGRDLDQDRPAPTRLAVSRARAPEALMAMRSFRKAETVGSIPTGGSAGWRRGPSCLAHYPRDRRFKSVPRYAESVGQREGLVAHPGRFDSVTRLSY